MIDKSDKYLLMIEPDRQGQPSVQPINDELTQKIKHLYSITTLPPNGGGYKGWHQTQCGKDSDNKDHFLPNGVITNSLCVYYIQHYRPHIPQSEIDKINKFYKMYEHGAPLVVEEEEEDEN